jgi:penicillin-binding protein 1A
MLRLLMTCIGGLLILAIVGVVGAVGVFYHFGRGLPDYRQLADYEPPVMTRVHAADGSLISEYAQEKRVFVPIEAMPKHIINTFLAAEDKSFYEHPGVNMFSVARAMVTNLRNIGSDRRPVGASTITQQVAKNFLLTNEVSLERRLRRQFLLSV